MAQQIKQGDIFGRIGTGFGKGLAEQVPKEIERGRLASGLRELEGQSDLTPFQQFARLSAIPGITPQMIQSGSELLRQQGIGRGLQKANERNQEPSPFQKYQEQVTQPKSGSITTTTPVKATIQPYIPPTRDQILAKAGEIYETDRSLYPNPQDAIPAAMQYFQQQEAINTALQNQRKGQQDVQSRVQAELKQAAQNAGINVEGGTQVPDTVYQEIENRAIDDVNNGIKTELEAAKFYKNELDKIAREYKALDTVGKFDYMIRDTKDIKRNLKDIRDEFKKRNDLENLADSYISKNGLSPAKAYYLAFDPSENKILNNALVKLPDIKQESWKVPNPEKSTKMTYQIAPEIAKAMGKEGSPLAIGEELAAKGYDRDAWFNYLSKNKKSLDLSERQARELQKPKNSYPTLNDFWLFNSIGLDKLMEQ